MTQPWDSYRAQPPGDSPVQLLHLSLLFEVINMATRKQETGTTTVPLFLSVPAVAQALGIGQTSTWMLIKEKKLPVTHIGRRTLVSAQALADFAANLSSAQR